MRPTSRPQSAIRYPLNHILGTEANVRVLRVILTSDIPIGVAELARLTELQKTGVARVCTRLEDLGVIRAVGRGDRNRQYQQHPGFPLQYLRRLFAQEREIGQNVQQEIQAAVHGSSSNIRSAWIEGPFAEGRDRPEDSVVVGVLTEPADVDRVREAVWSGLLRVQSGRTITIELLVNTEADLRTADAQRVRRLEDALPLFGPPPSAFLKKRTGAKDHKPGARTHAELDARSRDIGQQVADLLRNDPSIVEDTRRDLERRLAVATPRERLELQEWQDILATMSLPRLRRFLVDGGQRATRLRQSMPFLQTLRDRRNALAHHSEP